MSFCGIWWLGVAAVLFFPDASDESLSTGSQVGLVLFSLVPTLFCLGIFRSGLRGPFAPASS